MNAINIPDKPTRDSWDLYTQICKYNIAFNSPTVEKKGIYALELGKNLIIEEVATKCLPALNKYMLYPSLEHLAELSDGIVDSVVVLLFLAHQIGLPFNEMWNEVQNTQWAKIWPDGLVHRQGAGDPKPGKIIKPDGWKEPDLLSILIAWQDRKNGVVYAGGLQKHG